MFHSAISVSRGRGTNLHTFFGLVHPAGKKPFKRGALFGTLSGILLMIGVILTCLAGLTDVVGGPLLIAVGSLLFLISMRQFYLARKRHMLNREAAEQLGTDTVTAMVSEREQEDGTVTVIMDTLTPEEMFSCNNDCEPPTYNEATETSLNDSVILPEEVNEQNEDPPSYAEALEDSCPTLDWIDPPYSGPNYEWGGPANSNIGHSITGSDDLQNDPKDALDSQNVSMECIREDEDETQEVEREQEVDQVGLKTVTDNTDNTEVVTEVTETVSL